MAEITDISQKAGKNLVVGNQTSKGDKQSRASQALFPSLPKTFGKPCKFPVFWYLYLVSMSHLPSSQNPRQFAANHGYEISETIALPMLEKKSSNCSMPAMRFTAAMKYSVPSLLSAAYFGGIHMICKNRYAIKNHA